MSIMTVRFIKDARSRQTGNYRYTAGDIYDVRDDWGQVLVDQGLAVDVNAAPPDPEPEPLPTLEDLTMAQLRKMAAAYEVKLAPRKADLIANIRTALTQ
jgi:hypothetical protein